MIIKYFIELRDKQGKKRTTINGRCTVILHFLDMDDIQVNKHKIKRHLPYDESTRDDRPYSIEEIQRIRAVCDQRSKAMVLLMVSTGMRIGAISRMEIGDLVPVSFQTSDEYDSRTLEGDRSIYLPQPNPMFEPTHYDERVAHASFLI